MRTRERSRRVVLSALAAVMLAGCGIEADPVVDEVDADEVRSDDVATGAREPAIFTDQKTSKVVPILLIPRDRTVTATQLLQLRQALDNVRLWYQRELPDKDVRWGKLEVLHGRLTAAEYLDQVWGVIPGEIDDALGWNPWDDDDSNHIALVIGRGLLGWAGGAGYPEGRGLAVVGLEPLVDQAACAPEWWCNQQLWHGAAIHELGHGFTLPHDDDPGSIMAWHGDYKHKHLVTAHKKTVQANPAMRGKRPTPMAAWTFDECVEGTIADEWTGAYGLALTGDVRCTPGLVENGAVFDGVTGLAETTRPGARVRSAFTITAWVKPDRTVGVQNLVNQWYVMDAYALAIDESEFVLSVTYPEPGGWGRVVRVRAPRAVAGAWSHVAGVYDGKELRLYVDGALRGTTRTRGELQASERPIAIGNHPTWNAFAGQIDALRIYRSALTRDDIFAY